MSVIRKIASSILYKLPLHNIIIFEGVPDFSEDVLVLFKYFVEHTDLGKKYRFVWFIDDNANKVKTLYGQHIICVNIVSMNLSDRIKRVYYNYVSRVIIESNRVIYKKHDEQIRIHIPHGLPVKYCKTYMKQIVEEKCDLFPISSPWFYKVLDGYFGDCMQLFGLPRDQIIYDHEKSDTPFVVWMPTFRQHKMEEEKLKMHNSFPLGIPSIHSQDDLSHLNQKLSSLGIYLLLRIHPAQDKSLIHVKEYSNIMLADDEFLKRHEISLYNLIGYSTALITDYSSVYWDYLYLNRPIGLSIEDEKEYDAFEGLIYKPYFDHLPGYIINNIDDFIVFMNDVSNGVDVHEVERNDFVKEMQIEPLDSCRLIYEYLDKSLK